MSSAAQRDERPIDWWIKFAVLFVVAVFLGWLFFRIKHIALPFVFGAVLAYIANPMVSSLVTRGFRRSFAVLSLFLMSGVFLALFAWGLGPKLVEDATRVKDKMPYHMEWIRQQLFILQEELGEHLPEVRKEKKLTEGFDDLQKDFNNAVETIPVYILKHSASLAVIVLIPFIAVYFLLDGKAWLDRFYQALPTRHVETVISLICEANHSLGSYIRGVATEACVVGALTAIGLTYVELITDVPLFAVPIGVLTGAANLVPYFGPTVGFLVAGMIAFIQGGMSKEPVILVAYVFIVVQLLDAYVIQLVTIGKSVHLHHLMIVFVLFVGGFALGLPGMILAVPVTVVAKVFLEIFWERFMYKEKVKERRASYEQEAHYVT